MRQEFSVHMLNQAGIEKASALGEAFSALLDRIDEIAPESSREKALVVTHLQHASFFAKRAVAILPENQK